jgi:hypothetical protein
MRIPFNYLESLAKANGFNVERKGRNYEIFSNDHMPGVEITCTTLTETHSELYHAIKQYRKQILNPTTLQPF